MACVDDRVADYLDTGKLPKRTSGNRSDVKCDPVPAPEPPAVNGRSAKTVDTSRYAELQKLKSEALPR